MPSVPSRLRRRDVLCGIGSFAGTAAASAFAAAQAPALIEERWSVGGLVGTFARPGNGPARGPAALILAGSGPTLRDGTFGTYRKLAHGLAAAGVRSLRYDKRGVGESSTLVKREDDLVLQSFADDALAAARDLQDRPDVSVVVLVGHSEGALLVILAAAKIKIAGIALLASPGRRFDVVLREQLTNIPLPPDQEHYRTEAFDILTKLASGRQVPNISKPNLALFRPSVQPFLISIIAVDPAAEIGRLTVPAMIIQGASDIQVTREDYAALTNARPDATALLLPQTNHVFTRAPADLSDRAAQIKSYDPKAPLVPDFVPALAGFINAVAAAR